MTLPQKVLDRLSNDPELSKVFTTAQGTWEEQRKHLRRQLKPTGQYEVAATAKSPYGRPFTEVLAVFKTRDAAQSYLDNAVLTGKEDVRVRPCVDKAELETLVKKHDTKKPVTVTSEVFLKGYAPEFALKYLIYFFLQDHYARHYHEAMGKLSFILGEEPQTIPPGNHYSASLKEYWPLVSMETKERIVFNQLIDEHKSIILMEIL